MAEFSSPATLTTPAATITFNPTTGDGYYISNITGLDGAPLRVTTDPKPQADGGIVHPAYQGAREITVEGILLANAGVYARNVQEFNLTAALDSILRADGTWAWTPTGIATLSLTVRCDMPVAYTGGFLKNFTFGLVAADPGY